MYKYLIPLLFLFSSCSTTANSIVKVNTDDWTGSGFVVASDGNTSQIVTNQHVCSYTYKESVEQHSSFGYHPVLVNFKNQFYKADIIAISSKYDLCLLMVYLPLTPLPLAKSSKLTYKELLIVESPDPYGPRISRFIGEDKKSHDEWTPYHRNSYWIKGQYESGQSGSPVLNRDKEVVGVFWGAGTDDTSLGCMIGLDALNVFLNSSLPLIYTNQTTIPDFVW